MEPGESRVTAPVSSSRHERGGRPARRTSWILGLSRRLPGSPPAQGIGTALLLLAFGLLCEAWTRAQGLSPLGDHDRYLLILFPSLTGYILAIVPFGVRESLRDLEAMRSSLAIIQLDGTALEEHLDHHPLWMLAGAILLGLAVALGTQEFVAQRISRLGTEPVTAPRDVALLLLAVVFWVSVLSGLAVVVANALFFTRLGDEFVQVNLLLPSTVQPFARIGLRYVGMIAGLLAIVFFLAAVGSDSIWSPGDPSWDRLGAFAISAGFSLLLALFASGIALILPSLGIRRAIRREKSRVLGEIDEHIGDHTQLLPGSAGVPSPRRRETVDLLILRERIDSVPEWPFDHLTRARFVGLMLIPGASWVGSAVLERLIL